MDGFEQGDTVIVLAATNRAEILDAALLRPGRFDRRVTVPPPDKDGRRKILEVHSRSLPLADDVDLDHIAAITPGMVGADIANLANEAALLAARRGHEKVDESDFTDSLEKIILGAPRGIVLSEDEKRRTAYHEAGHAIVGMLTPGADPVRKVSIIPRTMSLGVTISSPDNERTNYDEEYLTTRIKVALGGRIAEEIVYGSISAGAESDIQQLTGIARQMVGRWGMSPEIGPIAVIPSDAQGPLLPGVSEVSEATQEMIDREVRRIVDEAYQAVTQPAHRAPRQARQPDRAPAGARDAGHGRGVRRGRRPGAAARGGGASPERRVRAGRRSRPGLAARAPRRAACRRASGSRATSASGASRAAARPWRRDPAGVLARADRAPTPPRRSGARSARASGRPAPLSGETTYIASWPSSELSAASRSACARS